MRSFVTEGGTGASGARSGFAEDVADGGGDGGPAALILLELFSAGGGDFVDAGAAFVFGDDPVGGDPTGLFHAMEGGVEGAFLDAEEIGDGLDVGGDAITVEGAAAIEDLQDQEGECALERIEFCHRDSYLSK